MIKCGFDTENTVYDSQSNASKVIISDAISGKQH